MEEELKSVVDSEIKKMIAKRDELKVLIEETEGKYEYNKGKFEKTKEQLEYSRDLEKIEKEIQNLDATKKEIGNLFSSKKQKENEKKAFKKSYDTLQKDKEQLEEKISQLKKKSIKSSELAEYENDLSRVLVELEEMQGKISSNEKDIIEINNDIEKLNKKYNIKSKKENEKEEKEANKEEVDKKELDADKENKQDSISQENDLMGKIRKAVVGIPKKTVEKEESKDDGKIEDVKEKDEEEAIDVDKMKKYDIKDAEYKVIEPNQKSNEEKSENNKQDEGENIDSKKNDKYSTTEITIGRKVKIKMGNAVYMVSEKNMKNIVKFRRKNRLEILNKYNDALKGRYSEDFLKNLSKISCTPLYAIDKSNMPEKDKLELINRIIRQHENTIIANSGLEVGKIDIDRVKENIESKKKYYEDLEALGYDISRKRDKLEKVCEIKYDLKDLSKTNIINRLLRKEIDDNDKTIILAEAKTYQTLNLSDTIGEFKPSGISKFISKLTGRELPKLLEVNETINNKGKNEKGKLFRKALKFNKSDNEKSKDNKEEQKHTKTQVEELNQSQQKQVSSSDGMEK